MQTVVASQSYEWFQEKVYDLYIGRLSSYVYSTNFSRWVQLQPQLGLSPWHVPMAPLSNTIGAISLLLVFRTNTAYDRWWEARKVRMGI